MTQPNSGHLADTVGEPTNRAQKVSALPKLRFQKMNGYQGWVILSEESGGLIAEAFYLSRADEIVTCCNAFDSLVERVAKLEEVIADLCRAIEDYAPEDNVALNQAWFLAVEAAKP